jgi:hypothetical protein
MVEDLRKRKHQALKVLLNSNKREITNINNKMDIVLRRQWKNLEMN